MTAFPRLKYSASKKSLGYVGNHIKIHNLYQMGNDILVKYARVIFQEHYFDRISNTGYIQFRLNTIRNKKNRQSVSQTRKRLPSSARGEVEKRRSIDALPDADAEGTLDKSIAESSDDAIFELQV